MVKVGTYQWKLLIRYFGVLLLVIAIEIAPFYVGLLDLVNWFALLIATIFCSYFIYKRIEAKSFNIGINLWYQLANGITKAGTTKAVILVAVDKTDYTELISGKKIQTPEQKFFYPDMHGRLWINLLRVGRDSYEPMLIERENIPSLRPITQDDKGFMVRQNQLSKIKKESVWAKYSQPITVFIFAVALMLILSAWLQSALPPVSALASALTQASNRLATVMEKFYGNVTPNPLPQSPLNQTLPYNQPPPP